MNSSKLLNNRVPSIRSLTLVANRYGNQFLTPREKQALYSALEACEECKYAIRVQLYVKERRSIWIRHKRLCLACITQDHGRLKYHLKILENSKLPIMLADIPLFTGIQFVTRKMKGSRKNSICFNGNKYSLSVMPTDSVYRCGAFRKLLQVICGIWKLRASHPDKTSIDKAVLRVHRKDIPKTLKSTKKSISSSTKLRRLQSRTRYSRSMPSVGNVVRRFDQMDAPKTSKRTERRVTRSSLLTRRRSASSSSSINTNRRRHLPESRNTKDLQGILKNKVSERLARKYSTSIDLPNADNISQPSTSGLQRRASFILSRQPSAVTTVGDLSTSSDQVLPEENSSLASPIDQQINSITNNNGGIKVIVSQE